jgi:hypothetical protein
MSVQPIPSETPELTCANCGAGLLADQRYCLSCGHPCSPVRLAFLDVLQGEQVGRPSYAPSAGSLAPATLELTAAGYAPLGEQTGTSGWLRRYSGLFSLLSVLVLCLLVGLLVGHWATQSKQSGPQIIKVEGLSAAPAAGGSSASAPSSASSGQAAGSSSSSAAKEEAEEAKQAAKETKAEKAPPPPPKKIQPTTIKKLTQSQGAQHQQEIKKLIEGGQPIETG